jgi:hypothetical protein
VPGVIVYQGKYRVDVIISGEFLTWKARSPSGFWTLNKVPSVNWFDLGERAFQAHCSTAACLLLTHSRKDGSSLFHSLDVGLGRQGLVDEL